MSESTKKWPALRDKLLAWTEGAEASSWALVALLILTPILVVPAFTDIFGPAKIVLLYVLVSFAVFAWIAHVYRTRAWLHRAGWMLWLPGLLLVSVVISAIASSAGMASWVGSTGQGFTAAFPVLALLLVYAMTLSTGEGVQYVRRFSFAAMLGVVLALIMGLLAYVGVPIIGADSFPGFSPTSTFESLTILGVVMSVFAVGIWVVGDDSKEDTWLPTARWKWAFLILGAAGLVLTLAGMLVTDTWPTQVVLLVGSGLFVGLGLFDPKAFAKPSRVLAPMLLFAFALILLIVQLSWTGIVPVEASPGFASSANIAMETLAVDGPFGSGPGTFGNDFTRFKSEAVNQTPFWSISFDHSASHVLTLFATWGLVPFIILVLFVGWTLVKTARALIWERDREDWQAIAVLGSVWMMLLTSQIVYSSDLPIQLIFWVVTGLLLAHLMRKTTVVHMKPHTRSALLVALGFVLAGVAFVAALFFSIQWMTSEVLIARAIAVQNAGGSSQDVTRLVGQAAGTSRWHAGYTRSLAISHIRNLNELAGDDVEANAEAITHAAESAMALAQHAIALDPADVRNVRTAADIYTNLIPVVSGSDVQAAEMHRYARNLDPANPLQHLALSRALLTVVDNAAAVLPAGEERDQFLTQTLAEAEEAANISLSLRPIAAGFYTRTLVYDRQGRLDEAIEQIENLIVQSPQDAVLRFELGVLQIRAGEKDLARVAFESALERAPTYANAKWYLAALYEEAGEIDKAIIQLEDLRILNPEDNTIQDKLDLLRQGQIDEEATEEVEPLPSE